MESKMGKRQRTKRKERQRDKWRELTTEVIVVSKFDRCEELILTEQQNRDGQIDRQN